MILTSSHDKPCGKGGRMVAYCRKIKAIPCPNCGNTQRVAFGEKWAVLYAYEQWTENCGEYQSISDEPEKYEKCRLDKDIHCWCPECNHEWIIPNKTIEALRRETLVECTCEAMQ